MQIHYLFLVADLGDGGQERQLYYLVSSLVENGLGCAVIVWDFNEADKYVKLLLNLGVDIIALKPGSTRQKLKQLIGIVNKYRPRILHSFSFHLNFPAYLACLGKKTRAIGGIRSGFDLYQKDSSLPVFLLSAFTPRYQVSNNTTYGARFWGGALHNFINRVFVVSNCLDISDFNTHQLPQKNAYIVTASIGRLYAEKRVDLIIQVVKNLVGMGFRILHMHAGSGPLLADLQRKVNGLGLSGVFQFVGTKANINAFLKDADFFIHASDYEGYPNVIMEAMASGRPVVTTNCGDAGSLVRNGVNGYIVPVGDVDALTEKAATLINSIELRTDMGREGRQIAEREFSKKAFTDKMLEVYNYTYK